MAWRHSVNGTSYFFPDLATLLARATPLRSGDQLAGIAAETASERAAAQYALADTPLAAILNAPVIPYEQDDVTLSHAPVLTAPVVTPRAASPWVGPRRRAG